MAWLVECLPSMCKSLGSSPAPHKPGVAVPPIILALRRNRLKFKITLGYTGVQCHPDYKLKAKSILYSASPPATECAPGVPFSPRSYSLHLQSSCLKHGMPVSLVSSLLSSVGLCLRRSCWHLHSELWASPPTQILSLGSYPNPAV